MHSYLSSEHLFVPYHEVRSNIISRSRYILRISGCTLPQNVCHSRQRDVVAVGDVGMIIVKLLVFVRNAHMCQFAGQQTRSEMEQILVVAATIKEEQAGRDVVVPFMLSNSPIFRKSLPADSRVELAKVNGQPALITRSGERAFAVLTIDVEANQIQNIFFNC